MLACKHGWKITHIILSFELWASLNLYISLNVLYFTKYQYCYKIEDNEVLSFYICLTTIWANFISCQLIIMFIRFDLRYSFYSFYYIFIRPVVWYHWLWSIVLWSSLLVQLISFILPIFMCIYLDIKESAFPFIQM